MNTIKLSEETKANRRGFLGTAAMTIAAAEFGLLRFFGSSIQQREAGHCSRG
jgi:hypothetical protein